MAWLKRHLTEIFCVLFLSVVVGVVAARNYTSRTFLTGIDNFHIEFDLGLAAKRAISGVWQDNQGVGVVSGLAQMTELPRIAIYWVMSHFLNIADMRYFYVLGNLLVGVWGVFFLAWYVSKSRLVGVASGLFYLFNLGTLQVFFMPTEMFVVNFAALPWLFYVVLKYLSEGTRASLLWYAGLLFLFAPMAMTPTIFVVYVIFLGISCVGYNWKRVLAIMGVTLGMSMYFLLPFTNFALYNSDVLTESKINSVFSQENYLTNAGRTSWRDLATLKGMWFDYPDNVGGKLVPLLRVWDEQLQVVGAWMYVPVLIIVLGLIALLWKRRWQGMSIVVMGVVAMMLLRGENPPLGIVVSWMRNLPMVVEALRTPYTKIAPILMVVYAVLFGVGVEVVAKTWRFKVGKIVWKGLVVIGFLAGFAWLYIPYFQGKMISEGVRVMIPTEYFEMFKFFKTLDRSDRIVRLPAYNSQAWDYTNWGYRGSGFLWYGIEQPILDRAFDVWSPYNETFNNEFSNVLYGCEVGAEVSLGPGLPTSSSQLGFQPGFLSRPGPGEQGAGCEAQVQKVLQKYDVRYVLLDESVIAPGQGEEILKISETKELMGGIGARQVWQEGLLTVWDMGESQITNSPILKSESQFISAPESYTWVGRDTSKVRKDVIYDDVGTYVSGEQGITYPFANFMREEVRGVEYGEQSASLIINHKFSNSQIGQVDSLSVQIPGWKAGEILEMGYRLRLTKGTLQLDWEPLYKINEQPGPKLTSEQWSITSNQESVWVGVGGREVYVTDKPVRGVARLVVGEPIEIKIYGGQGVEEKVELGERQDCGEEKKFSCWAIPLTQQKRDSLLQTITHFEGTISPEVCLDLEGEPYQCLNDLRRGDNPMVVTQSVDKGEKYWLDYVVKDRGTVMREIGVVWYPVVKQWTMDNEQWTNFEQEQRFTLQGPTLKVEVASKPTIFDFAQAGKTRIDNCDILGRGTAEKYSQISNSQILKLTQYVADERGAVCDYVEMSTLDSRLPYLMRVKGEDVAGRSLKYFLYNTTSKRNDLEYLLDKGKFDQTFVLLPWMYSGSYSLNIETRSFGQKTENLLEPVEVRYFPLEQITGARLVPARSDLAGQPTRSDLRITEVKKTGTWLYRVKTIGTGLLRLSQGYDRGWVSRGLQHVKVDGWANGWILGEGGEREVVIFFWPQLLEYLGFAMLGVTALMCFGRKKPSVN